MISIGAERRVFVSTRPVDFRKGVHGLVALVAEDLKCNPYCSDVYVFRAKRKDRLKLFLFDGSGTVLATKWLENSDFAWPQVQDGVIALTPTQFAMLLDGLSEWARIMPKAVTKLLEPRDYLSLHLCEQTLGWLAKATGAPACKY